MRSVECEPPGRKVISGDASSAGRCVTLESGLLGPRHGRGGIGHFLPQGMRHVRGCLRMVRGNLLADFISNSGVGCGIG